MSDESINQESIEEDKSLYIEFHIQNYLNKVGKVFENQIVG